MVWVTNQWTQSAFRQTTPNSGLQANFPDLTQRETTSSPYSGFRYFLQMHTQNKELSEKNRMQLEQVNVLLLEKVNLQGYNPLSDLQIVQLLLPFTNLQALCITENKALDRLGLLLVFNDYDERHGTPLLPGLRILSFEYIYFWDQLVNPRFSNLLHFLRRRSESRFPISTVKLRECGEFLGQALESMGISIDQGPTTYSM